MAHGEKPVKDVGAGAVAHVKQVHGPTKPTVRTKTPAPIDAIWEVSR